MTDENTSATTDETKLPEEEVEEEVLEETPEPEGEEPEGEETVELTAEEKLAAAELKLTKLESDNENYKKAVKAAKQKSKPEVELPTADKGEFVSKKEFIQESQAKAKAQARELYPELNKDEHWDEIITEFYSDKKREGATILENTFLNLENAALLYKARQAQVDNSEKTATAEAGASKTTPSKGDTSQPKKTDNTESEDYYLDKFGLSD